MNLNMAVVLNTYMGDDYTARWWQPLRSHRRHACSRTIAIPNGRYVVMNGTQERYDKRYIYRFFCTCEGLVGTIITASYAGAPILVKTEHVHMPFRDVLHVIGMVLPRPRSTYLLKNYAACERSPRGVRP